MLAAIALASVSVPAPPRSAQRVVAVARARIVAGVRIGQSAQPSGSARGKPGLVEFQ
ncbi:MAG: hypothetical protein IPF97_05800 [Sphingomonadales bacterium]|nr:hypothetical protein [Sphingomonadales bacterium]MBK6721140.1 hypothetical protein [Sphingomonadales bacterium]MBK8861933.1 hypothetical protein [Sphingomonadales bacterium]MBK9588258.1 hypothetical protein [Sphingomonadales bacterium]MBP7135332.1 hypothetical protein [Sphingomonadaceae bacterium]